MKRKLPIILVVAVCTLTLSFNSFGFTEVDGDASRRKPETCTFVKPDGQSVVGSKCETKDPDGDCTRKRECHGAS